MNTNHAEKLILLEASGELGSFGRWRLRHALARSPELRAWRSQLNHLEARAAELAPAVPATPRDVMASITEAARAAAAAPRRWLLHPAWASAAASLLLLATYMTIRPGSVTPDGGAAPVAAARAVPPALLAWEDGFDQQLADIRKQIGTGTDTTRETATSDEDLDTLAGALLDVDEVQI